MRHPPRLAWFAAVFAPLIFDLMRRLAQPLLRRRLSRVPPCTAANVTPYGCPLPPVVHRRIDRVKPGRLIIVGDVHGCPELFRLLETLRYDPSSDNLLLAGDLVNKGPASLAVLDAFPSLDAVAVRGNHDDAVLGAWLRARRSDRKAHHGDGNTGAGGIPAKFAWAEHMSERQAAVLAGLPFTVSVPQYGIAVVHAGLVPGVPLEQQDLWAMYKMRNVAPRDEDAEDGGHAGNGGRGGVADNGDQPAAPPVRRYRPLEKAKEGGEPWAALWRGPHHVFFGHDARRGLQRHPAATGLDTGAVYGGALTAAVIPPLAELLAERGGGDGAAAAGGGGFAAALAAATAAGRAVTREELRVELVAVPAAEVYSPPSAPAAPATAAAVVAAPAAVGA